MARIAGVNLPSNKRVLIGLTYIYGIGKDRADKICQTLNILSHRRIKELTDDEILQIRNTIESKGYLVEGDLRKKHAEDIRRLIEIRSYRGERLRKGLPAHGQRTHSNAMSCRSRAGRGTKRVTIAGKKK